MATTPVSAGMGGGDAAPIPSASSADFDSALGEALSVSDAPSGEEGAGEALPTETPIETPIGEEPTPVESAPQTAPQAGQPDATASPYPLSPDGQAHLVPKADLPGLMNARQYQEQVSNYFATPAEAKTSYEQAADSRIMTNDWLDGSDAGVNSVLAHWAGANHFGNPMVQQRFQQSFAKMAQRAPEFLKQINPQAYETLVTGMVDQAISLAYTRAAQTGNPEDFKRAQELDWGKNGTYKTELPKADPNQQAMTDFQRQQADFNARQDAAYKRDVAIFNTEKVEGLKFKQLDANIEKELASVKGRYAEPTYEAVKQAIRNEVINAVKAQPEWYLEHEQDFHALIRDYQHTWRQGSPGAGLQPRVQKFIADYLIRANRVLPSIAQKHLGAATRSTKTTTPRNANGTFAQPAQPRPATAAPVQRGGHQQPPGRVPSEQFDAELAKVFAPFR